MPTPLIGQVQWRRHLSVNSRFSSHSSIFFLWLNNITGVIFIIYLCYVADSTRRGQRWFGSWNVAPMHAYTCKEMVGGKERETYITTMEGGGRLHSEIHNIRTKAVPFAPFQFLCTTHRRRRHARRLFRPVNVINLGMSLIHNWYEALGYINEQTEIQARAYNLLGNQHCQTH